MSKSRLRLLFTLLAMTFVYLTFKQFDTKIHALELGCVVNYSKPISITMKYTGVVDFYKKSSSFDDLLIIRLNSDPEIHLIVSSTTKADDIYKGKILEKGYSIEIPRSETDNLNYFTAKEGDEWRECKETLKYAELNG